MMKPQIFEHSHFLLHHEARLNSELQGLLCTGLGWGWLGVDAAGKRVVVDDGNDDLRIRHFLWFFAIISILIFKHINLINLLLHPPTQPSRFTYFLHHLDNGFMSGVRNELIAIINIR